MSIRIDEPDEARRGPTMRPPSRARTRIALIVVALAVGVLVGTQVNSRDEATERLAGETTEDLTTILADLNAEADALARQLADLRLTLFEYESSAERDELALRDARKRLADLQVLAGTVPVTGPGIRVTIADPRVRMSWDQLLDLVQELRDAGAEAIGVNGRRIVASTWFAPADAGVLVAGRSVLPPYVVEAVGSTSAMREALQIPGGPISIVQAQPEVDISVEEVERMRLPAAPEREGFDFAEPAG